VAAYYNEIDPYAAQWLRNLIAAGHIAPGEVDERSIEDVRPDDLKQYTQCHFFAGIGVWSYALRLSGWADDEPVWTMSCPCQPFSAAGKGAGFDDERHLWPSAQWLVAERRPAVVFGEQVASKDAEPWLDLVSADLEGLGYAFGATAFPSAGVGAPHIRDRTYFVAHANDARSQGRRGVRERAVQRIAGARGLAHELEYAGSCAQQGHGRGRAVLGSAHAGSAGVVADSNEQFGRQGGALDGRRDQRGDAQSRTGSGGDVMSCELADASGERLNGFDPLLQWEKSRRVAGHSVEAVGRGPVNGFWRAADWISCRDDRWRPVEPGTFPLANGAPARVGRLRAYGNAINAEAAKAFIEAAGEALDDYDLI
jgi:DNA (cytosine-5)-methyltransferase 1